MRFPYSTFLLTTGVLFATAALPAPLSGQSRFDLHQVEWIMTPAEDGRSIAMQMELAPLFQRDRLILRIPLWRPGSYRYANYQDNISDLKAVDSDGLECTLLELDPRTWEVDTRGVTALTVTYTLKTTNEADKGKIPAVHLRSPATFLYTEDSKDLPHSLKVNLPKKWDFASGHRPAPEQKGLWRSPNYDVFVDCPIALGDLERHSFESHGTPFEFVLFGRRPSEAQFSRADWSRKLKAMCEVAHQIFGDYPFEKYTFLFLFSRSGGISGLEHLNSTSIVASHSGIKSGNMMEPFESVTAHEFFHTWNVKRIRPEPLGPFDYASDVRTKDLWWMEGITSYYNDIILQRAGLRPEGWFWKAQAQNYLSLQSAPGFGHVSPQRASWTVWEPSRSKSISYYISGQSLGLLLDLKIRLETKNQRSLDDVMAFLARWVNYPEKGYRPGDLERAVRAISGWDCSEFFDRHVAGLVPPPFSQILPAAGLTVVDMPSDSPYLGIGFQEDLIMKIREGRPSFKAGIRSGDILQKINGKPVADQTEAAEIFRQLVPGDIVRVEIQRDGIPEAQNFDVTVEHRGFPLFKIRVDPEASAEAIQIREGLLLGIPQAI